MGKNKKEEVIKNPDNIIHENYTIFYSRLKKEIEEEFPKIKPSSPEL